MASTSAVAMATKMVLVVLLLCSSLSPATAQYTLAPSFTVVKSSSIPQEGVAVDGTRFQDSTKGKISETYKTPNGAYTQYLVVNTTSLDGMLYYAYDVNGSAICYRYAIGAVQWPFPSTPSAGFLYVKAGTYLGLPMDVYGQNVGRYVRRMYTNAATVVDGSPFRVYLTDGDAMSTAQDATIANNTLSPESAFDMPAACTDASLVRALRAPRRQDAVTHRWNPSDMRVPPEVKFNVRDATDASEEFVWMVEEVGRDLVRNGHLPLKVYELANRHTLLDERGLWVGPASADNSAFATAIRNQGACGGCWAFSSAALTEVVYNKKHNITAAVGSSSAWLSVQNLLDCATGDMNGTALFPSKGCFGGWPLVALSHIVQHGVVAETAYPYDGVNGRQCLQQPGLTMFPLAAASYIPLANGPAANVPLLMAAVVQEGGVVAILNANPTLFYPGGIFNDDACTPSLGHAVVLVGFGTDAGSGLDYWIVKNSFGSGWGEGGFFRIVRGVNMCGIEQMGFAAIAK